MRTIAKPVFKFCRISRIVWGSLRDIQARLAQRCLTALILLGLWLASANLAVAVDKPVSSLLWRVSKTTGTSYLLGTVHSEDARVLDFPVQLTAALEMIDTFAMELVPDLATVNQLSRMMSFSDQRTLPGEIGETLYQRILPLLQRYGISQSMAEKMKPWAAMMTLSTPPPESGFFMDFSLAIRAAGAGKTVIGLETLEEQIAFLEGMPRVDQQRMLRQSAEEFDRLPEMFEQMISTYVSGDLNALRELAEQQLVESGESVRDYFVEQGLNARNRRMLERALPLLEADSTMIAVGALHLPGEHGLIQLLRDAGYSVTPVAIQRWSAETNTPD